MTARNSILALLLLVGCQATGGTEGGGLKRAQSELVTLGHAKLGTAIVHADSVDRVGRSLELTGVRVLVDGTEFQADHGTLGVGDEHWSLILDDAVNESNDGSNTVRFAQLTLAWPRDAE